MSQRPEKRRVPFETKSSARATNPASGTAAALPSASLTRFFSDYGVRETIESILVAIVLALLFRSFQAEAFIIPTGSMAPTLQGQHLDLVCEKCKFQYRSGASEENSTKPVSERKNVTHTFCPICQYRTTLRRQTDPDHRSNQGDRILVNKFIYDFQPPERFDVIVFKNPNNGKQNYIKRLIGLPNENILIENGDIHLLTPDGNQGYRREIVRKPANKLLAMLQMVDDTQYIAPELAKVNWPLRWQQWEMPRESRAWKVVESGGKPTYSITSDEAASMQWLRYRHLIPRPEDWELIEAGTPIARLQSEPGRWIGDYYAYNDIVMRNIERMISYGANWVGDLGMEALLNVESPEGNLALDLVEGGAHFRCSLDVATGKAQLSCSSPDVQFVNSQGAQLEIPSATTGLKGPGRYHIRFVNADDQLRLWINDRLVTFDADCYLRSGKLYPAWSANDPGDAEPIGLGVQGGQIRVHRLRVLRDIYYTSISNQRRFPSAQQETRCDLRTLREYAMNPQKWESPEVREALDSRLRGNEPMFRLAEGQFLPMGDNSPESLDARIWGGPSYVEEDLLLGRALFVYWPHSLNKPIPYFPNFRRMGPIR